MAEESREAAAVLLQSLYRKRKCVEALRLLRKREAHRNQVVQEILKTEQLYVSNLRVVVGVSATLHSEQRRRSLLYLNSSLLGFPF